MNLHKEDGTAYDLLIVTAEEQKSVYWYHWYLNLKNEHQINAMDTQL